MFHYQIHVGVPSTQECQFCWNLSVMRVIIICIMIVTFDLHMYYDLHIWSSYLTNGHITSTAALSPASGRRVRTFAAEALLARFFIVIVSSILIIVRWEKTWRGRPSSWSCASWWRSPWPPWRLLIMCSVIVTIISINRIRLSEWALPAGGRRHGGGHGGGRHQALARALKVATTFNLMIITCWSPGKEARRRARWQGWRSCRWKPSSCRE